jgi:hypothetical protein
MSFRILNTHPYSKVLFLMALLLVSGTLILARWKPPTKLPAEVQGQRSDAEIEAEMVTATPLGFEPAEITRPQGRFLLAVENATGRGDLNLYLERETEGPLNVTLSRRGRLRWREILDLPAGRYILRSANDESWRCGINLTPR